MTLHPNLTKVDHLLSQYQSIRKQSEDLCTPLKLEDFSVQPVVDVSPPKWHLGHISWFFENFILVEQIDGYELYDERLNWFFNSYYESQGPRILRSNRGNMTRPTVNDVLRYRRHVDARMQQLLEGFENGFVPKELADLIVVGLQHEQQHQELLVTDIKYILGTNPLYPAFAKTTPALSAVAEVKAPQFLPIEEGVYEIGYDGSDFCWDNELSVHKTYIHECKIMNRLVTNGEFLEFLEAGGYEQHQHWLSDGWAWVQKLDTKAPLYWYKKDGEWYHYTLQGLQKIDPNLPVTHLSYYEADAYANWKGMRLPTEAEWEVACRKWYDNAVPESGNFLETQNFHPIGQQSADDYQMLGSVWEWTGSAYLPYPNYPRFKGALGEYNGKFMIDQMVLRGGSCATPHSHIRITYRNFFQTAKRWQFTGCRLVK